MNDYTILLLEKAEQGDADAQLQLGYYYFLLPVGFPVGSPEYSEQTKEKSEKTAYWFKKAADQGNAEAQFKYAEINKDERIFWYQKAADNGYVKAQYKLACYFYDGIIIEQDYKKAVSWFKKAADQGHVEAQYNLGNCYFYGNGTNQDFEKAINWFRKADIPRNVDVVLPKDAKSYSDKQQSIVNLFEPIMEGFPKAQFKIGLCYYEGKGVERKYKEAIKWFNKAANQFNYKAQFYLGKCYEEGLGFNLDVERAIYYYQSAAKGNQNAIKALIRLNKKIDFYEELKDKAGNNNANSQFKLAYLYYEDGFFKNNEKAIYWFRKVTESDNNFSLSAKCNLKKILNKK